LIFIINAALDIRGQQGVGAMKQVNSAFTRKRKMLRNSLQHLHSSESVQSALSSVGLPETVSFLDHQSPQGLKILNISSLGLSAQNRISAEICYKYV
jgi:16S rRNA A1518/A1519 N6-dimethyltransferase RsmA/KsgA/DIM1 with predicted DNA glycosylase/AP lyase activity